MQANAGFRLSKSAPQLGLQVGQQSVYTLTVEADADVAAEVKDQLPQDMTLVSASGSGWNCDASNAAPCAVLCTKSLAASTQESLTVTVKMGNGTAGKEVTNYASAGEEGAAPAPGASCTGANCASSTATVAAATGPYL